MLNRESTILHIMQIAEPQALTGLRFRVLQRQNEGNLPKPARRTVTGTAHVQYFLKSANLSGFPCLYG